MDELGCGAGRHFREGDIILESDGFSNAVILWLDQDAVSCAEVERKFANHEVRVVNKSVSAAPDFQASYLLGTPHPSMGGLSENWLLKDITGASREAADGNRRILKNMRPAAGCNGAARSGGLII